MKLILCSEGFNTEEIIAKSEELVGKKRDKISIAVINEAYAVEEGNNLQWVLNNLNVIKNNFGGDLDLINLLALDMTQIERRIEKHDIIFVNGGHTDYLMSVFNKTGFATALPTLLKSRVYVGSSAGSMVLGQRLSSEAYNKIYHERNDYRVTKYMGMVDICIMPHLDSPHFTHSEETLQEAVKGHTGAIVYGLRDDTAVIFQDNKISTIGSDPFILG